MTTSLLSALDRTIALIATPEQWCQGSSAEFDANGRLTRRCLYRAITEATPMPWSAYEGPRILDWVIVGDGYISINRSVRAGKIYHGAAVGIAGTRREPHDFAASFWGGTVSCYIPRNAAHRPQFQWSRQGVAAAEIIRAIEPFLLVKREHAWLALQLTEHIEEGRSDDPFPWYAVQVLAGHSTIAQTEKYAHLAPGYKASAVDTINL